MEENIEKVMAAIRKYGPDIDKPGVEDILRAHLRALVCEELCKSENIIVRTFNYAFHERVKPKNDGN